MDEYDHDKSIIFSDFFLNRLSIVSFPKEDKNISVHVSIENCFTKKRYEDVYTILNCDVRFNCKRFWEE